MEALWMVAGAALGAVVVYLAARAGRPGGLAPEASSLDLRVKALEADIERLRLDFSDLLDRVGHLYDRIRKRLQLNPELNAPPNGPPPLSGKAAIRARARVGGLLK